MVSTLAGSGTAGDKNGTGTTAQFRNPYAVAVDSSGNVYVADRSNHRIRKITPGGVTSADVSDVTTFTAVQFNLPYGVAVVESDDDGDDEVYVYVADFRNHRIRKIEYK